MAISSPSFMDADRHFGEAQNSFGRWIAGLKSSIIVKMHDFADKVPVSIAADCS
jgi:hypothetical protein